MYASPSNPLAKLQTSQSPFKTKNMFIVLAVTGLADINKGMIISKGSVGYV